MCAEKSKKIVVLATGGTIAGVAGDPSQPQNYRAGQVPVTDLLAGFGSASIELVSEQVAQVDSKDMSFALWQQLLARLTHCLAQEDVLGAVITHGTDTVEETAYFLHALLPQSKPVALTCAMLPANAPDSDGPDNLKQALGWVQAPTSTGVVLVCAGQVHSGQAVQKSHSQQRNPFSSTQSQAQASLTFLVPTVTQFLACQQWPRVELVNNHVGADGRLVRVLMAHDAPEAWVLAGTGNGTVHQDLEAALLEAQKQGALVLRASRCSQGGVQSRQADTLPHAGSLSPAQARVALCLHLIALTSPHPYSKLHHGYF